MTRFELSNIGSASFITSQVRKNIRNDKKFDKRIQNIKAYIIKNAN